MGKSIRVALAMGGGTSQGTFSGVALTEALKLLVLYGDGGKPCEDVTIDAMSGASAGSITLAILLRTLMVPVEHEATADARLKRLHGKAYSKAAPAIRRLLLALQSTQDQQWKLWARHAFIQALLGTWPGQDRSSRRTDAGLLYRRLLDDMARFYLDPQGINLDAAALLAPRVLFCCTLANLTPIRQHAERDLMPGPDPSRPLAALADALSSKSHRDLRVFDINLEALPQAVDPDTYPESWVRCHPGAGDASRHALDLRTVEAWGPLAATAMASGAFPFGFAPISLTRHAWELPSQWPWEPAERPTHAFTYVDGGTFENEPLREAFRLAAFLDATHRDGAERIVLFVDPNVSSLDQVSFRVPILRRFGREGKPLKTPARLAAHVGTMFQAIRDQASAREADRAFSTRALFPLRDQQRRALWATVAPAGAPLAGSAGDALRALRSQCEELLHQRKSGLPASLLTLPAELQRVIDEELRATAPPAGLAALRDSARVHAFCDSPAPEQDPAADLWLYLLHCVFLDLSLDLSGKRPATIVPVAPLWDPHDAGSAFDLPNEAVGTFAGFFSATAQRYTFRAGRHCAARFLQACGVIPGSTPIPDRPTWRWPGEDSGEFTEEAFRAEVRQGLEPLLDRLREVVDDADVLPVFDGLIARAVVKRVETGLEAGLETRDRWLRSYELRLFVPGKDYVLLDPQGKVATGFETTRLEGRYTLVTVADHAVSRLTREGLGWQVSSGHLFVRRWNQSLGIVCTVALPSEEQVARAATLANPVFEVTIGPDDRPAGQPGVIAADRWGLRDDVECLDDLLFRRPRPQSLPDNGIEP